MKSSKIFHELLRQIVQDFGENILAESRLKGIMGDLWAGSDKYEKILSRAINDRIGEKLLAIKDKDTTDFSLQVNNIKQAFQEDNFLHQNISDYIVDSFIYALGKVNDIKEYVDNNDSQEANKSELLKEQEEVVDNINVIRERKRIKKEFEKKKEEERKRQQDEIEKCKKEEEKRRKIRSIEHENKQKKTNNLIISCCVLGIILFAVYYFFYIPYATDRDAPRYYTFTNLNLRSSEVGEVEYNLLDLLPYGSELITYSVGDEWANVKAHGKKGVVSSSLILPSEDFHLLNSIWGNSDAKECVATAKCRLALLDYFKRANLNGGTEWQLYTQKKDSKPNTVFYPRVYDKKSKFTDFAFLVKNNQTKKRMFVLYSFDDETEEPVYRYDMEAPEEGYISGVTGYWTNSGLRMTVAYSKGTRKTVTVAGDPPVGSSYGNNSVSSSNRSSSTVALPSTVDYSNMSAVDLNKEGDRQYDQQNYSTAFVCYQMAAQKGLLEAKANLGWMYYKGYGTQRNPDMAVKYLKEAADNGNANACYYMGLLSETGIDGTYKNTTTARYYYEKGARLGQEDAQKRLQQLESQLNMQQETAASGGQTVKINENALYKTSDLSVQPEFPGGQNALLQFLSSSIVYPRVAQENGIQGTVYCSFVVERTGDITDIMITKGADGYLNAEALRVLRTMPNWKPGRIGNTPVRVRYTIPVRFRLQ